MVDNALLGVIQKNSKKQKFNVYFSKKKRKKKRVKGQVGPSCIVSNVRLFKTKRQKGGPRASSLIMLK